MNNLLIITQKVDEDDDVLGFFIEWIRKLANESGRVTIICLKKGKYHLPDNVKVLSMGKEDNVSKPEYLRRFYSYIYKEKNNYDSVFVHMNPIYVVLGGPLWRIWRKKIVLWYAHGHVNNTLKLADKMTNIAVASTPEGYRVRGTKKLKVIGQGIDTEKFKPAGRRPLAGDKFKIVTVGRVTLSKDHETLIKAIEVLGNSNLKVGIAGQPGTNTDIQYMEDMKNIIKDKKLDGTFEYVGPIANKDLPPFLQSADLFVNMSHTGSLDKAILEAMSCGLPILTCNEALENVLGEYKNILMYPKKDFKVLAERINSIYNMPATEREKLSLALRQIVVTDHDLGGFIKKLSGVLFSNG